MNNQAWSEFGFLTTRVSSPKKYSNLYSSPVSDLKTLILFSLITSFPWAIISDFDLLESIFRTNTLKFRGSSKDNFFTKHADSVVAIYTDTGMGSGAIINKDGFIVTNYHVTGNNEKVRVVFKPKNGVKAVPTSIHEADVISIDPTRDLALVKPLFPPKNFKPVSFSINGAQKSSVTPGYTVDSSIIISPLFIYFFIPWIAFFNILKSGFLFLYIGVGTAIIL